MIRSELGVEAFGVNAWSATAAGQELIGEHDELGMGAGGHEEMYVVVSGHATFTIAGEPVEAPEGTVVFVKDPALRRSAVAREEETTILVVGARAGAAFEISAWERSAEALRYWTTGEWEEAVAALERQLAEHPDNAGVLYNLACAEARMSQIDAALAHLSAAIALEPRFLDHAQSDSDLDGIRTDPRFPDMPDA
jgi:tetratricopeptide (TPR) repeat protein